MIDPPEVFVLGPYITNMLGKPGTVMPKCACAPPTQAPLRSSPVEVVICIGNMNSVDLKPVAQTMQSTSSRAPADVTMALSSSRAIESVTSSTFARCNVGRYCELNSTRLQPNV